MSSAKNSITIYHQGKVLVSTSIKRSDIVIGTAPTAHIRLKHNSIARRQLLISQNPAGEILIDDLCEGRQAKILLNGLKVRKANIVPGDIVSIGPFDIHIGSTGLGVRKPAAGHSLDAGTSVGFSDDTAATQHKSNQSPFNVPAGELSPRSEAQDNLALDRVSQSLKSLLQSPQEPTNQKDRSKKNILAPSSAQVPVGISASEKNLMFGERKNGHSPKAIFGDGDDRDSPFKSQQKSIEAQISSIERRTGDKSVIISLSDLHDSTLTPELGYYTDGQLISIRKLEAGVSIRVPPDQFCLLRQHGNGKISVFFDGSITGTIIRNNAVHPIVKGSLSATVFDRLKHIYAIEILPRDIVQILRGRDNYLLRFVKPGSSSASADNASPYSAKKRRRRRSGRSKWPILILLAAICGAGLYTYGTMNKDNIAGRSLSKLKTSLASGYGYLRDKIGLGENNNEADRLSNNTPENANSADSQGENGQLTAEADGETGRETNTVHQEALVAIPQVHVTSGNVTKFEIQSLISSRQSEIDSCFKASKTARSNKNHNKASALNSRLFVMEDGTIGAAVIEAANLSDLGLFDCVLENLRDSFLDTKPGEISEVTASILHPTSALEELTR